MKNCDILILTSAHPFTHNSVEIFCAVKFKYNSIYSIIYNYDLLICM